MKVFFSILLILSSCRISQKSALSIESNCNRQNAIVEVERLLRKKKYNLDRYDMSVKEDSLTFIISYELKDELIEGGGMEALISKTDCQAIRLKLYQ